MRVKIMIWRYLFYGRGKIVDVEARSMEAIQVLGQSQESEVFQ